MDNQIRGGLHRPVLAGIVVALEQVFNGGKYAKIMVEQIGRREKKWGGRDRRLFAEILYDMVRWWRRLLWAAEMDWVEPPENNHEGESGKNAYSNENFWKILECWVLINELDLPVWFKPVLNPTKVINRWKKSAASESEEFGVSLSLTDWMVGKIEAELGVETLERMFQINEPAPVFIRTNLIRSSAKELQSSLLRSQSIELQACSQSLSGFLVDTPKKLFQTEEFKKGLFEVQDLSSQKVAPFLMIQPGQRVIDACAGAGGKSIHLADLMKGKGTLIALDINKTKLQKLTIRARRAQYSNIETRWIEGTKTIKRLRQSADRVLLDVPCSGMGVLRRNPDTKWKLNENSFKKLILLQQDILSRYSQMVKPGGKLVYSTCSIFPSENEQQIQSFLARQAGSWHLEEEVKISMTEGGGGDGFYMARLGFSL